MSDEIQKSISTPHASPSRWGRKIFLLFLGIVASLYGVIVAYHLMVPVRTGADGGGAQSNFLEKCRDMCLSYGLVPTGHLANDAKAYLRSEKPRPLAEPLHEILGNGLKVKSSDVHPLLGQTAPEFELPDDHMENVSLGKLLSEGPVVVVFYYGYHCNHCVGQLFGLNEDMARFQDLGTRVVAISGDAPELTAKRFAEYGRFNFPVLSDKENKIAERYGVFRRENELLLHGTFVIDGEGKVIWCNSGNKPFLDNKTLLHVIAQHHGLIASDDTEKQ